MAWLRAASLGFLTALSACVRVSSGGEDDTGGVRVGDFERIVDLTGEVRAERGEALTVPQTRAWQVPIRWLVEDGSTVATGERVAELDASKVSGDLDQKRAAVVEAEASLRRARADAAVRHEQSEFELARAQSQLAETRLQAGVPAEILSAREHDERQLALRRAEAEVGKAEAALARVQAEMRESAGAAELALERTRRELTVTESELGALALAAPKSGIALVQEHPWEGRKLQTGDTVFPGLALIQIPDLDSLYVAATLFDVDDGEIDAGDPARCLADAFPAEPFPCRVREVAAVARELSAQSTRRAFRVVVDFDDRGRARARLRPGASMRVEVVAERREGVTLVSRSELRQRRGVVDPRSRVGELDPGSLGPCNASDCVVATGGAP